ncbi:MAG: lysophospholipid acyltransferase family protein [Candidatus Omnitrophota bacterium]
MRILKLCLVALSFLFYLIITAILHVLVTLLRPSRRWQLMSSLSYILIRSIGRILGLKIEVQGQKEFLREKGNFLITRHVSYVDGLILGGLCPAIFVSKKEIQSWPLIGQVIAISGTIFINRKERIKAVSSIETISRLLKNKTNIIVFPEGTSTDGDSILSFQTPFFQSPIVAQADVLILRVQYHSVDGQPVDQKNKDQLFWYGDMNFFSHFWNLCGFRTITIKVSMIRRVPTRGMENTSVGRKTLSEKCYQIMQDAHYNEKRCSSLERESHAIVEIL